MNYRDYIGARDLSWKFLELLRARLPGFEQAYIVATGPQLGVRDSRQLQTRYRITAQDVLQGRVRDDGVALGGWPRGRRIECAKSRRRRGPPAAVIFFRSPRSRVATG